MRQRAMAGSTPAARTRAPRSARRRAGRRRSALLLGMLGIALIAAVIALKPTVDDAIREITLPLRHEDVIRQQAREKNLDPALVAAVIYRESKFRDVTSEAGAKGLMQILPSTAQFIAHRSGGTRFELHDLANPQINISYGSWYLRYLLDRYGDNVVAAVAAYNAGHGRVDDWGGSSLQLADIRFAETEQYARDVMDKRGEYADKYRSELGL
ncbi:MAG: lytic transglycosylase domain-containing protein [Solirubrobacterales bacterium]